MLLMLLLPALERSELVEAVVAAELVMMVSGTCAASFNQRKAYYSYVYLLCISLHPSCPSFQDGKGRASLAFNAQIN